MRRSLLSFFAVTAMVLAPATPSQAQVLGVKLGASFANLDVDVDDAGTSRITGFAGGGFLRFGSGRLGLQLELLSVTKGSDFVDPFGDDDAEIRLEYVEMPLLIHVPLSLGQAFSPYVFAGPTLSLESGCSVEFANQSRDCDDAQADVFRRNKTDFGLAAGGGLAFAMGPGSVLVEGRYTWGLSDINNTDGGPTIRNRAAYLMAGYMIPLVRGF
jgi:opacity protein-like surface antigen